MVRLGWEWRSNASQLRIAAAGDEYGSQRSPSDIILEAYKEHEAALAEAV